MPFPVKFKDQAFSALTLVQDDVKTMTHFSSHFLKIRLAERLAFIFFLIKTHLVRPMLLEVSMLDHMIIVNEGNLITSTSMQSRVAISEKAKFLTMTTFATTNK